jgi:isopenicillin N synthase-like dioxygenase
MAHPQPDPPTSKVSVIDLSGPDDGPRLAARAAAIDEACRTSGFFAVRGHGVPVDRIDAALDVSRRFFSLPTEVKERYRPACPPWLRRGYTGLAGERQSAAVAIETPPDLSEIYTIGPIRSPEIADRWTFPDIWPDDVVPETGPVLTAYRRDMDALARRLLRLAAVALTGASDRWDHLVTEPLGGLRLNHYPEVASPVREGQSRAGAHTDYSTVTVLAGAGSGGLEIEVDGVWSPVDCPDDGLLVNVGDVLAAMSEGRWHSTWHRVPVPPAGPTGIRPARTTIAFFLYPDADARVPNLRADDGIEVVAGDYLSAKVRALVGTGDGPPTDPDFHRSAPTDT